MAHRSDAEAAARGYRLDGIPELVLGALWLLWGVVLMAPALRPDWAWSGAAGLALPAVLLAGSACVGPVVRGLKKRITVGRAGPESSRRQGSASRVFVVLFALTAGAAFVWVLTPGQSLDWQRMVPLVLGLVIGLTYAFQAWRYGLSRYRLLSLYALAAACVLTVVDLGAALSFSMLLILLGAGVSVAGGLALRAFLRRATEGPAE